MTGDRHSRKGYAQHGWHPCFAAAPSAWANLEVVHGPANAEPVTATPTPMMKSRREMARSMHNLTNV